MSRRDQCVFSQSFKKEKSWKKNLLGVGVLAISELDQSPLVNIIEASGWPTWEKSSESMV